MYKFEYLPIALLDMVDIVRYISRDLCNPTAAEHLATELIETGDSIPGFPYANPAYAPIRPLKHEYRKLPVANYIIFYRVDESKKEIIVSRVIYAKRDYRLLLD